VILLLWTLLLVTGQTPELTVQTIGYFAQEAEWVATAMFVALGGLSLIGVLAITRAVLTSEQTVDQRLRLPQAAKLT
jgi:hypothetical protein